MQQTDLGLYLPVTGRLTGSKGKGSNSTGQELMQYYKSTTVNCTAFHRINMKTNSSVLNNPGEMQANYQQTTTNNCQLVQKWPMILKLRPTKRLKFGLVTQACKGCRYVLLSVIANVICCFLTTNYCPYAVFSDKCFFTCNGRHERRGSASISGHLLLSTNNGSRRSSYYSHGGVPHVFL